MEIKSDQVYTVVETAKYLKCGTGTIYKYINEKKLKALKIGHYKIKGDDILKLTTMEE